MLAIVAARSRYLSLYPDVPMEKLVIYVTTQTHSLGLKAGLVLGLPVYAFPVRTEDNLSLRGEDLREVIERDKAEGKHPFVISEVDPPVPDFLVLKPLPQSVPLEPRRVARLTISMRLARSVSGSDVRMLAPNLMGLLLLVGDYPDIWLHIDAAWLGAAFSCPEYRERCRVPAVNEYADSLCVNFHKVRTRFFLVPPAMFTSVIQWGLVSLDCSGMWVRNRKNLTEALDITPPFLRSSEGDAGSYSSLPQNSRRMTSVP